MGIGLKNAPPLFFPYLRSRLFQAATGQYEHKTLEENIKDPRALSFLCVQIHILGQSIEKGVYRDFPKMYFFHCYKLLDYFVCSMKLVSNDPLQHGVPYFLGKLAPSMESYDDETRKQIEDYRKTLLCLWEISLNLPSTVTIQKDRKEAIIQEFENPYFVNHYLLHAL